MGYVFYRLAIGEKMDADLKKSEYEHWCGRSAQSILQEHPLWMTIDPERFHKRHFMSEKLYEAIHTAIYRYDPMAIGHVSVDEYDMEILSICTLVEELLFRKEECIVDELVYEDLFEGITKVFGDFFGEAYLEDDFTVNACKLASKDIFEAMKEEVKQLGTAA